MRANTRTWSHIKTRQNLKSAWQGGRRLTTCASAAPTRARRQTFTTGSALVSRRYANFIVSCASQLNYQNCAFLCRKDMDEGQVCTHVKQRVQSMHSCRLVGIVNIIPLTSTNVLCSDENCRWT